MLRLTHQFDPPDATLAVASPKSENCSCCCCCCVATTLATSLLTARSLRSQRMLEPSDGQLQQRDTREPFIPGRPMRAALGLGWKVLACFFLPACIGLGLLLAAFEHPGAAVLVSAILWLGGLWLLVSRGNLSGKRVALLILLLIAGSVVEGFMWASFVLH
jgi:hypothetical protein